MNFFEGIPFKRKTTISEGGGFPKKKRRHPYNPRSPTIALLPVFGRRFPTKIDYRNKQKSGHPDSNLSTGGPRTFLCGFSFQQPNVPAGKFCEAAKERNGAVEEYLLHAGDARQNCGTASGGLLDCYWVGSLDFNFFWKSRGFPLYPQKS